MWNDIFNIFTEKNSLKSRKIRLKRFFLSGTSWMSEQPGLEFAPQSLRSQISPSMPPPVLFIISMVSITTTNLGRQLIQGKNLASPSTRWILLGLKQIFKNALCPNYSPFPLDLIGISGKQWRKFYCSQRYHACYQNKIDSRSSNRLVSLDSHESGILWLL